MNYRRLGTIALIALVVTFCGWCTVVFIKHDFGELVKASAFKRWSYDHCKLVNLSAGGFGSEELMAFSCDDGHSYIQRGGWAPDNWNVK